MPIGFGELLSRTVTINIYLQSDMCEINNVKPLDM